MIRINLLPIRQMKKRQRLKGELLGFVASFVAICVILALFFLAFGRRIDELNRQIGELEGKKAGYQKIEKEIAKIKESREALEKKLQAIGKLRADSLLTVRVLDEVASRTPTDRLWLTSLQQTVGSLQLDGTALDNTTIAQYMQQLDGSEYFQEVELRSSSQVDVARQKLKSFNLSVKVVPPQPPAPDPVQDGN